MPCKKAAQTAAEALQDFASLTPDAQVKQVEAAAKALFGDEFKLLPRYELDGQQQFEINNSWMSNDLLQYIKNEHSPVYLEPEEDWLHGAARVREKLHHAENCLLLREALGLDETMLGMHAIQLPFKDKDYHWLALRV
jgi:hypothetical protein